jgi:predicted site-specific integrase-resolvase
MSLMLQAYLLEKYGPRLGTDELAQVLGISVKTLGNKLYRGEVPIVTYRDQGKVWADCRDVAEYLDACRARAKAEATQA